MVIVFTFPDKITRIGAHLNVAGTPTAQPPRRRRRRLASERARGVAAASSSSCSSPKSDAILKAQDVACFLNKHLLRCPEPCHFSLHSIHLGRRLYDGRGNIIPSLHSSMAKLFSRLLIPSREGHEYAILLLRPSCFFPGPEKDRLRSSDCCISWTADLSSYRRRF